MIISAEQACVRELEIKFYVFALFCGSASPNRLYALGCNTPLWEKYKFLFGVRE
jgi:hypothetical protein